MLKTGHKKEKQEWTVEKTTARYADREGIFLSIWKMAISSKDQFFNERKKSEVPMEAAMFCKKERRSAPTSRVTDDETQGSNNFEQTKPPQASWRLMNPARKRLESALPRSHDDHSRERVQFDKSLQCGAPVHSDKR